MVDVAKKAAPVLKISDALQNATKALQKVSAEVKERDERIKQLEEKLRVRPGVVSGGIGMRSDEIKGFSLAKAFRGAVFGIWNDAAMERDAMKAAFEKHGPELMAKTATLGNPSNMGLIVPNEIAADIIQPLRSDLFLAQLGVTRRTGLSAVPYETNRKSESGSISWIGEGAVTAADVVTIDRVIMNPHTAAIASLISLKLLATGGQAAEAEIRESLQAIWERGIEKAFIEGTGQQGEPLGMISRAGNTTAIGDNADAKLLSLQTMIGLLAEDNVPMNGKLAYFMHDRCWQSLTRIQLSMSSQAASTTLTPSLPLGGYGAVQSQVLNGQIVKSLWGYPVVTSNNNTATSSDTYTVLFANWEECIYADWGTPAISFDAVGRTNQINRQGVITMFYDVDWAVKHPVSICTGTDFDVP